MAQAQALRTVAQNGRLWTLLSKLAKLSGVPRDELEETLRAKVRQVSGQDHTSRLTIAQAGVVLDDLQRRVDAYRPRAETEPAKAAPAKPGRAPWGERGPGTRTEQRITPAQQATILGLYAQLGWTDPKRRTEFCRRQTQQPWPQSMADADKLIEPLMAMVKRTVPVRTLVEQLRQCLGRPELTPFESSWVADVCNQVTDAEATGKDLDKVFSTKKRLILAQAFARLPAAS